MMESGYYPPGAEFDKNAPWNQDDEDSSDDYCEECDREAEDCECEAHDEFCAVNRASGGRCDCDSED